MRKFLLFLSHAGEEEPAARELAGRLQRAGVPVWLDVERLRPGNRWMESLEQALRDATAFAVYVGRSGVARWVGQEVRVALDRSVTEEGFVVIPILGPGADPGELPVFLRQHQWVDLRKGLDDADGLRELSEVVLGEDRRGERVRRSLLPPDRAPFLGLRTFGEEDAFLFYGRDREVEELLAALGTDPFLTVVGASGCGKSSLVRAGLLPALRRGRAPGDGAAPGGAGGGSGSPLASWRIALFRPADDPFRELAAALPDLEPELSAAERMAVGERAAGHFAGGGSTDGTGAAAGIERAVAALVPAGTRTLLVADQLEEVFTQTGDADARRRFLDALLAAGRLGGDRPVHVLATLRADFYSRCWEHPDLPRRMAANQYPVERMARDQLREVIEKPLALAGVTPEPGLTDELLDDAGDEPGNLPLLEHALFQLWDQPAGRRFTHEAYREMEGLAGALEHHAEAVFEGFGPEDRDLVRRLFLCLAVVGEGGAVTRRRVAKSDLLAVCGEGEGERERGGGLLARLVDRRLLTATGAGGEPGEERVEVAHEALLRSWDRLRAWLEEDREFLLWRQGLADAVAAWQRAGRAEGELLRGGPLRRAEGWLGQRRADLTPGERGLIEASLAAEEKDRERELTQARARAAAERRARQRLAWAALALLAGMLTTGWLMLQARRQARLAFAQQLSARAETVADVRPQLGVLLALESLRLAEAAGKESLPVGESALRKALAHLGGRVIGAPDERVEAGVATETAALLATTKKLSTEHRLILRRVPLPLPADWEISEGEVLVELEPEGAGALLTVALSSSGRWLAVKWEREPLALWWIPPPATERPLLRVELLNEHGGPLEGGVATTAFVDEPSSDPRTHMLWVLEKDGKERLWSLPPAVPAGPLAPDSTAQASSVGSGEGRSCARYGLVQVEHGLVLSEDAEDRVLMSIASIHWQVFTGHDRPVTGCHVEEDGQYLITWTAGERARLWDLQGPAPSRGPIPMPLVSDARFPVRFNAVAPRAGTLLAEGSVYVADEAEGLRLLGDQLACRPAFGSAPAAFSPDGGGVAYLGDGPFLCAGWIGPERHEVLELAFDRFLPGFTADTISTLAMGPAGRWVCTGSETGEVVLVRVDGGCEEVALSLRGHLLDVKGLAFSEDGRWLASGGADGLVHLYRFEDPASCEGPELVPWNSPIDHPITSLVLRGRRLAIGDRSGVVRIWNLEGGQGQGEEVLVGHRAQVTALAFDEAGERLASADALDDVWLWTLDMKGSDMNRLHIGEASGSKGIGFTASGDALLTISERANRAHRWDLDLERLRIIACRAAGRNLSTSEAREHIGEPDPPRVCPGLPRGVD